MIKHISLLFVVITSINIYITHEVFKVISPALALLTSQKPYEAGVIYFFMFFRFYWIPSSNAIYIKKSLIMI